MCEFAATCEDDARAQMYKMLEDEQCIDNYRFAYHDDSEAMAAYARAKASGCCGSLDRCVHIRGRAAMIGCNYGH